VDREQVHRALIGLYAEVAAAAAVATGDADSEAALSRSNLLAYAELRRHDLAELQMALADIGLSSLGRLEGHVLATLASVLGWFGETQKTAPAPTRQEAAALLAGRSQQLFGRPRPQRDTRVMVTLDHTASDPVRDISGLLLAGMDIARVNAAHGTAEDWRALVAAIREAERSLELDGHPVLRRCHVFMDLCGPRVRTGAADGDVRVTAGEMVRISRLDGDTTRAATAEAPATLSCTLPEALAAVAPGHRFFLDDGKVAGVVTEVAPEWIEARVTAPAGKARRVKPGKGYNFPDSTLALPALTEDDLKDLETVVQLADVVGLSFAHRAEDILALHAAMTGLGTGTKGIVAKIETRAAAANLTNILFEGLGLPAFGVMIARGDLAVEVGFEELAAFQENILCLCEAAHVPAIWATQVLETLARDGLPARAEITDAAAAQRADCVMLNKGPHAAAATALLDRLLCSEKRHREKKRELFHEFMPQAAR